MSRRYYHYPPRTNNQFNFLVNGDKYYPEMISAISEAKSFILFESYLFESGNIANQFITALQLARQRDVDIYMLLDDYGALKLSDHDKQRIRKSGIQLYLYNSFKFSRIEKYLKRDHRKLLVIDYTSAFLGGAGITDDFSPENNPDYWHDTILKVEGEIVNDCIDAFSENWNMHSDMQIDIPLDFKVDIKSNSTARLILSSGTEQNEITRSIVKRIRTAKEHVWLTSPYFISSIKVRRALKQAALQGIDVRLLFPGQHSDHKWVTYGIHRYYMKLLKSKIRIFEYQPRFTHSKVILIDDWYTTGSSNLDKWNQYLNLDINIEVNDLATSKIIQQYFLTDFKDSREVFIEEWKKRSLWQRFVEWSIGFAIYILAFISKKYKR